MQTLDPIMPSLEKLTIPLDEQSIPGFAGPEADEGRIGTGEAELGQEAEPLQGGEDEAQSEWESDIGNEGDGS